MIFYFILSVLFIMVNKIVIFDAKKLFIVEYRITGIKN